VTKPIEYALAFAIVALGLVGTVFLAAKTYRTVWPAEVAVPVPAPVQPDYGTGAKFAAALIGENAPSDAAYLRDLFSATAEAIERDGSAASPALTTRGHIATLADRLGRFANLTGEYQGIGRIGGELFQREFPIDPGELAPADRQKAVELFRALSIGAGRVAG